MVLVRNSTSKWTPERDANRLTMIDVSMKMTV